MSLYNFFYIQRLLFNVYNYVNNTNYIMYTILYTCIHKKTASNEQTPENILFITHSYRQVI